MGRKLTHDEQVAAIARVNPDVEVLGEIINNSTKVLTRCKICGHEWNVVPNSLKNRHGCPKCVGKMKLSHTEQVEAIKKVNHNVEILGEIINNKTKVLCRCRICQHEWRARPNSLKNRQGCPGCKKIKIGNASRKTHAEHVADIAKVNPDVEVLGEIKGSNVKVLCRCKVCNHKWCVTPSDLKNRYGCPECRKIKIANAKRKTHAEHVAEIAAKNPNVEVLEEIKGNVVKTKVLCLCKTCGHRWKARPNNLKKGEGCPRCAKTGFLTHEVGKLYIMVDNLELPTMMKIGVSVQEDKRSRDILRSAHREGMTIPALHVAKTWEGPTDLMQRIEQMMHENYEEWNIKFPAKFDGSTEFFQYNPETAEVFDIIGETIHELINANKAA
ncbi:zinc-ribbon domain-containing protein [Escherichia coli O169]